MLTMMSSQCSKASRKLLFLLVQYCPLIPSQQAVPQANEEGILQAVWKDILQLMMTLFAQVLLVLIVPLHTKVESL